MKIIRIANKQITCLKLKKYFPVVEASYKLADPDGNSYKTIKIDNQVWMAEKQLRILIQDGTDLTEVLPMKLVLQHIRVVIVTLTGIFWPKILEVPGGAPPLPAVLRHGTGSLSTIRVPYTEMTTTGNLVFQSGA